MSGIEIIPICPLDVANFYEKGWLNTGWFNKTETEIETEESEEDYETEFIDKNGKSHTVFIRGCPGDGSCFFWAIKEALQLKESVKQIRKMYVDSLDEFFDKLSGGEIAKVYKKENLKHEMLNTTVDAYIFPFTVALFCVNLIILTYDRENDVLIKSDIIDRSKVVPFANKCASVDTIILCFTPGNVIGHYEVVYAIRNKQERILFPSTDTLVRAIRMRG